MGTEVRGTIVNSRSSPHFVVVESRYSSGEYLPWHSHERAYVSIAMAGSYREDCGSVTSACATGQTIFHASGESHSNYFGDCGAELLNLMIYPEFVEQLRQWGVESDARRICASQTCLQLARRLRYEAFLVNDPVSGLAIEGLAMELCAEIFRRCDVDSAYSSDWLLRVDTILRDRFRESLSLSELAGTAQVHPVHLARAFRKRFGFSVGDQIRKLRIEAACKALQHSRLSIAEIAVQTGFSDQSHLSRTLKRHTGRSPNQFRLGRARAAGGV